MTVSFRVDVGDPSKDTSGGRSRILRAAERYTTPGDASVFLGHGCYLSLERQRHQMRDGSGNVCPQAEVLYESTRAIDMDVSRVSYL